MEENNDKNEITYKMYSSTEKEKKPSFFKNAFVPFCSSALATFLVIGVCFGTPNIRSKILGTNNTYNNNGLTITEGAVTNTVSNTDYSNTSIAYTLTRILFNFFPEAFVNSIKSLIVIMRYSLLSHYYVIVINIRKHVVFLLFC